MVFWKSRNFTTVNLGRVLPFGALLLIAGALIAVIASGRVVPAQAASDALNQAQPKPAAHASAQSLANAPQVAAPYDVESRSQVLLAHLNAVLRFYRDSEAPIQKVGEPSDLFYRNQAVSQATQIAGFAFQAANVEVGLINRAQGPATAGPNDKTQKVQQALSNTRQRITELKAQDAELDRQLGSAPTKKRAQLQQQLEKVDGELDLQTEMADALSKIAGMADSTSGTGFSAQVAQLERSAPGVAANKATAVAPTLENLNAARSMGVFSQAKLVFDLLHSLEAINSLTDESRHLHDQVVALRAPLVTALKNTIAQGQALSQGTASGASGDPPQTMPSAMPSAADTERQFKDLTATFKVLSGAAVPLSQEILTLEQNQANLQAWSSAVDEEYDSVLQSLLLRVLFIVIALGIIFIFSELWRRATKRYVRDVRRRRQLLVLRRFVTGFLVGLVLIFGLVTQFSSLATFAGLITAGIAVGLQTVLLSMAAYFFIVGRYGIKAGDRISIAGVTGDVVEVGLLRFYVMEMAGSGSDLYPSGRVAVFSNAVLFQATTPLYKQMPGTHYAWHELTVNLLADSDYRAAAQEILKSSQGVYEEYRRQIEAQHKSLELWMDSSMDLPGVQANLQLENGGLQLWVRFPVIIRQAAAIDEKMTEALLQLVATKPEVKAAVSGQPIIKAAVKS